MTEIKADINQYRQTATKKDIQKYTHKATQKGNRTHKQEERHDTHYNNKCRTYATEKYINTHSQTYIHT